MDILRKHRLGAIYLLIGTLISIMLSIQDQLEGHKLRGELVLDFLSDLLLIFGFISLMGTISSRLIRYLDKELDWRERMFTRLLVDLMIISILSVLVLATYMAVTTVFHFNLVETEKKDSQSVVFSVFLIILLTISIVIAFHEFKNSIKRQEELSMQSEILRRKNIESEYQMLKNQISPHFLFNNLSVLSSLVYKDPEKSDEFIKEFSKIFRYILELNNETVVTLGKEIHFLRSYTYLLKMRFGKNIVFCQSLTQGDMELLVPPLSTQFLIENVVKHNRIDYDHHLRIEIYAEDGFLIIKNNVMARTDKVDSTGFGLRNLKDKYRIISDRFPEFGINDGYYFAKLPLIRPEDA